jgi:threonylcarbamoyladenosine tRNA methylthiotransferase MtaB
MKVFLDTVGCRLNQSEIERMARQFRIAGHIIVADMAEADLVVVNTCAVTIQAASDSRQKIRQAGRQSPNAQIVATGCWATLEPEQAASLIGSPQVVLNRDKDLLTSTILGIEPELLDMDVLERQLLPGARHRTRAFIKVQDGCDAFCTFCVTRIARGKSRSVPIINALIDIQSALDGGALEIVLSGVQLGSWGKDLPGTPNLRYLTETILHKTKTPRLRFSSVEPWDLDEEFFEIFSDERICRHLHISLQSGCASTLKRMGRHITPEKFLSLLGSARRIDPKFSITTDVIAGFPGETEGEFAENLEFIRSAGFSGGHVFPYSPRPGTAAASMPGQLSLKERKLRAVEVRKTLAESAVSFQQHQIGSTGKVLWESSETSDTGFYLHGLDEKFIKVMAASPVELWNVVSPVRFVEVFDGGIRGDIVAA